MLSFFAIKVGKGRFASKSVLTELVSRHLRLGALVVQAGIMESSPVKSGNLRRSWTTGQAEVRGDRVKVVVGTNLVYARYQNRRTKNKGYVGRGIQASRARALQTIRDGILEEKGKLWSGGK